jgi:hypothetical protein
MEVASKIKSALWSKALVPLLKWNLSYSCEEGNYILDPFSVIAVLASNAFKPIGTKLSIFNGRMTLHDTSMIQSTMRTIYGDTKMNVKLLHFPVIYACKHYLKRGGVVSIPPDMAFLFIKAKKGLENLKHTYRDDREIRACINTYINIIQSCFEEKEDSIEFLNMLLRLNMVDFMQDNQPEPHLLSSSPPSLNSIEGIGMVGVGGDIESCGRKGSIDVKSNLFEELHRSWDINKISIVIGMLKELELASPFGKEHMFAALESFMMVIHEKTKQISETMFEIK